MKGNGRLSCIVFPVLTLIFLISTFYPSVIEGGEFGKETGQEANKETSTNYVQEQVRR